MKGLDAVLDQDATAQAELVRSGEVTALELVEAAIARIEALNPSLNAVIGPMFDDARRSAAMARKDAPFAGVPFLLKDLGAEYAGVAMSEGSAFLDGHYVSPGDSELTARHKRAGLIILGKTNTPEFGLLPMTEPRLHGPTRNPWDLNRTPGGSSGGSAAAVAAGMTAMAHANDGGGSIRIPASCCGLFGLKPTRGRNSLAPHYGDMASGLVAEHALTRSIRDSAALLDATAGPAPGEPYLVPSPDVPFAIAIRTPPPRLRIAYATRAPSGIEVHADCAAAVEATAKLCSDLGHEVVEGAPAFDVELLSRRFGDVWIAFAGWTIADWARRMDREPSPGDFEPMTWRMREIAESRSTSEYLLTLQDLQRLSRDIARFFVDVHVWLSPTMAQPPLPLGAFDWTVETREQSRERQLAYAEFTRICNVTGQPAMSLPMHWNADGLPIGVHAAGRYGDEGTLLTLAAQLEEARPWGHRRPNLGSTPSG